MDLNKYRVIICVAILAIYGPELVNCLEPLTMSIAAAGIGVFGYGFIKDQTYCRYYECCDARSIPTSFTDLSLSMESTLFGQHMVKEHVLRALMAHLMPHSPSRKPLVLSFHGTPGTGKSFVADQIAKAMYKNGVKSQYVHKFLGRADFSHPGKVQEYKDRITIEVLAGIKECPQSLFIFDEVDKMPMGVFDTLTSLIDYAGNDKNADYTKAVFIFLSNTAGVRISDHLAALMKKGILREDTRLSDFEEMLKTSAYNMEGGFKMTNLIEAHVIDHYIPFLALEKSHVASCVKAEFERWHKSPSQQEINDVISSAVTFDPVHGIFATSGCKTVEKKVAMAAHKSRT